jgi:flagellar motility protein MotE (MotC chaperone)
MSGYDKFFKEAGKASGLTGGSKSGKSPSPSKKPQFKLKESKFSGTAEDRLRQEVALRARNRRSASMRKRQKFPMIPAVIALVAIVTCTIGFLKPELADQILSHIEIGAFGKANAEAKVDAKSAAKKDDGAKNAETKAAGDSKDIVKDAVKDAAKSAGALSQAKGEVPPDFRNWSDEELSFFNKLNDRKKELDLREAELNKLDEELQKQKSELDSKIKQLEGMRADISKTLKTRVQVDQEKVDKLVQFYSTMKPQQAAKVIESINEDLAVEVMDKMKKKSAAEIMNSLKPEKARRLSELMTGYQRSPSSEAEAKDD